MNTLQDLKPTPPNQPSEFHLVLLFRSVLISFLLFQTLEVLFGDKQIMLSTNLPTREALASLQFYC
jgi:hypothetical protein